jgi:flotillin
LQLAPVAAQITLAKEIGSNPEYQRYLALIQALQAYTTVGSEQAAALKDADVKIIANGGSAPEGLSKVTDLFSSKGGTSLAAALEAFSQSDLGADLMARFTTPAAE